MALDIRAILSEHVKWVGDNTKGSRANLFGADLSGADLSGADLSRANLSRVIISLGSRIITLP